MNMERELRQLADGYRTEGYQVTVHPRPDDLPAFVADWQPDILARRGDHGVLVLVRKHRDDLAAIPDLTRRADAVQAQPGWRLDVVILEGEDPLDRILRQAAEPTPEQIHQRLDRAAASAAAGQLDLACLSAWAALEAAMRQTRDRAGLNGRARPDSLLTTLYSNGYLSREELHQLREASRVQTQLAHGFVPRAFDPDLVTEVIRVARKLVNDPALAEANAAG